MKRTILILSVVLVMLITGCKKEQYGSEITVKDNTPISQVLKQEDSQETFSLEGKIGAVCPSGCWFFLEDESGEIYVDLAPSGIAIPQRSGKEAKVEGSYIKTEKRTIFVAKGVEIK